MSQLENNPDMIEHRNSDSRLRVIRHPDEGHVHPDPELEALLGELTRRGRTTHGQADDADGSSSAPDAARGKESQK